ncbi:hypothetical protein MKW92_031783 [Papaver armeniacum]|nr:hypothetical protein MKW92_031783 [Papaver armeniacum]
MKTNPKEDTLVSYISDIAKSIVFSVSVLLLRGPNSNTKWRGKAFSHTTVDAFDENEGDGRLGFGPGRGPNEGGGLSIPSKVKGLSVPVAAVSCGGFFTTTLTKEGQIWNRGARKRKQSWWLETTSSYSLQDIRIIQIACGGYHSLALTGKVLSWGHGGHVIACEGSTSAAITDKGKLYMWGNSRDCQLGVPGLLEVQHFHVEVKFPVEYDRLGPHHVLSVAIGASHAMCLVLRSPIQTTEER